MILLSNPILRTVFSLPRLIFIKLLEQMPRIDLFGIEIRGTDTASIEFKMSGGSRERAEICIGPINCCLASALGSQECFRLYARFLDIRAAPSHVGWMPSLLRRPGLPQKSMPIVYIAYVVGGAPLRQPTIK